MTSSSVSPVVSTGMASFGASSVDAVGGLVAHVALALGGEHLLDRLAEIGGAAARALLRGRR